MADSARSLKKLTDSAVGLRFLEKKMPIVP